MKNSTAKTTTTTSPRPFGVPHGAQCECVPCVIDLLRNDCAGHLRLIRQLVDELRRIRRHAEMGNALGLLVHLETIESMARSALAAAGEKA